MLAPANPAVPASDPGVGGEAVDIVAGQSGVGNGGDKLPSMVRSSRTDRRPASESRLLETRDDGVVFEWFFFAGADGGADIRSRREEREADVLNVLKGDLNLDADGYIVGLDIDQIWLRVGRWAARRGRTEATT